MHFLMRVPRHPSYHLFHNCGKGVLYKWWNMARRTCWTTTKSSSSSNLSIRAFRACPLIEIRQTVPCRANSRQQYLSQQHPPPHASHTQRPEPAHPSQAENQCQKRRPPPPPGAWYIYIYIYIMLYLSLSMYVYIYIYIYIYIYRYDIIQYIIYWVKGKPPPPPGALNST